MGGLQERPRPRLSHEVTKMSHGKGAHTSTIVYFLARSSRPISRGRVAIRAKPAASQLSPF